MSTVKLARLGEVLTLTTADGESRQTVPDEHGVWCCPFCGYATLPADEYPWAGPCANPVCIIGGRGSAQQVAQIRAELAARAAEADQVETIARQVAEARQRDAEKRQSMWQKVSARAEREGACLTCLHYSDWQYGRPKYTRHRRPDFHERLS
jgi:hypothetical protein